MSSINILYNGELHNISSVPKTYKELVNSLDTQLKESLNVQPYDLYFLLSGDKEKDSHNNRIIVLDEHSFQLFRKQSKESNVITSSNEQREQFQILNYSNDSSDEESNSSETKDLSDNFDFALNIGNVKETALKSIEQLKVSQQNTGSSTKDDSNEIKTNTNSYSYLHEYLKQYFEEALIDQFDSDSQHNLILEQQYQVENAQAECFKEFCDCTISDSQYNEYLLQLYKVFKIEQTPKEQNLEDYNFYSDSYDPFNEYMEQLFKAQSHSEDLLLETYIGGTSDGSDPLNVLMEFEYNQRLKRQNELDIIDQIEKNWRGLGGDDLFEQWLGRQFVEEKNIESNGGKTYYDIEQENFICQISFQPDYFEIWMEKYYDELNKASIKQDPANIKWKDEILSTFFSS